MVTGAGKEEAGKPMGYDELPPMEKCARAGRTLPVENIPGMRSPMSMSATSKFLSVPFLMPVSGQRGCQGSFPWQAVAMPKQPEPGAVGKF